MAGFSFRSKVMKVVVAYWTLPTHALEHVEYLALYAIQTWRLYEHL